MNWLLKTLGLGLLLCVVTIAGLLGKVIVQGGWVSLESWLVSFAICFVLAFIAMCVPGKGRPYAVVAAGVLVVGSMIVWGMIGLPSP